ncbi:MAG: D-lactate dehydrogenase VanH-B [Lachnospiraceae bacterium]|jgi:D-specific alpha-keto acid dehydrogenase|nr:D-lactate dehydrogenase VanH-B [Lachnospiraceae bacterium]
MKTIGITVFGCEPDEAAAFKELSPHLGALPAIVTHSVSACVSIDSIDSIPATGNRCISVDHKSSLSKAGLQALRATGVRYISTRSIGTDHIDIPAAQQMGITVGNAVYSPDGVADYTLMLLLMALRNAKSIVTDAGQLDFRLPATRSPDLADMTVGVVGTGRIGRAVIRRLQGFGCRIITYSRSQKSGCASLPELLAKSDIVTLHTPLNDHTSHLLGHRELLLMKPGSLLINTGRGGLVDTAALLLVLEAGHLGGAALDVIEGEEGIFYSEASPDALSHPFLRRLQAMPNVIITPHTAFYTRRALYDTVRHTIKNCLEFERSTFHG